MFQGRARCSTDCRACSTMPLIDQRATVAPIEWYQAAPRLGRANRALCRGDRGLVRGGGGAAHRQGGPDAGRHRRHRVRLDHRDRDAQHRRAGRRRGWAFATTSRACRCSGWAAPAGSPGSRTAARLAAAEPGQQLAVRHGRNLLDLDPPRQRRPGRDRRHGAVRRRRRGRGRLDRGRSGIATIGGAGEKLWPDTLGIMGWRVEDPGLAVVFDRAIPPFVESRTGRSGRRDPGRRGLAPQRHRPLLLPPRRGQGGRGDRDRARAAAGTPRPRARRACAITAT